MRERDLRWGKSIQQISGVTTTPCDRVNENCMFVEQLTKFKSALRQAHAGPAILIGDARQLRDELADGFIHLQIPAPDNVLLLAL